jgi:hypothetical protein
VATNLSDITGGLVWWGGMALFVHICKNEPLKRWERAAFVVVFLLIFAKLMKDYFECVENADPVPSWLIMTGVAAYAVITYVLSAETLMLGLAPHLTRRFGDRWIDGLGYLKICATAVAVLVFTTNHVDTVLKSHILPEHYWPLLLASALVLELLQLRARLGRFQDVP